MYPGLFSSHWVPAAIYYISASASSGRKQLFKLSPDMEKGEHMAHVVFYMDGCTGVSVDNYIIGRRVMGHWAWSAFAA